MAGIVKVVNDRKWQSLAIGEPFDSRSGLPRRQVDDHGVSSVMRLALEVSCEQRRIVSNSARGLEARAGGRNKTGRQRGRSARDGIALQNDDLDASLVDGQGGTKAGRASSNHNDRSAYFKSVFWRGLDAHGNSSQVVSGLLASGEKCKPCGSF